MIGRFMKTLLMMATSLLLSLACVFAVQTSFANAQPQPLSKQAKFFPGYEELKLWFATGMNSAKITLAHSLASKQDAIEAQATAQTTAEASKMSAQAYELIKRTRRMKDLKAQFNDKLGQGYSPCGVAESRSVIVAQQAELDRTVRDHSSGELYAGPGVYRDPVEVEELLLKDNARWCSSYQTNIGLCEYDEQVHGDPRSAPSADFSTLLVPTGEDDDLTEAKTTFINNVIGLPHPKIPESMGKSEAAAAYMQAKAQHDATISPAITSLQAIALDSTAFEGTDNTSELSLDEMYKMEIGRYFGGEDEHENWSKTMAQQNAHGLLVEQLKIKALDLAIQAKIYRQYERMEANLATLTAMSLRDGELTGEVRDSAAKANQQNIKRNMQ